MFRKLIYIVLACSFLVSTATIADGQHRNVELLASSCAACHGTNGHSVGGIPNLAGMGQLHFIEQMGQFIDGTRQSTVMFHHAGGYTAAEIKLLAEFFSSQKK